MCHIIPRSDDGPALRAKVKALEAARNAAATKEKARDAQRKEAAKKDAERTLVVMADERVKAQRSPGAARGQARPLHRSG